MASRNEEISRKFNTSIKNIHEKKNVDASYSIIIAMALENPKIIKRGIDKIVSNNVEAIQRNILISENKNNLIHEIMKFYKTDEEMAALKVEKPKKPESIEYITDDNMPENLSKEEVEKALENRSKMYDLIVKGRLKLIPSSIVINDIKELCDESSILSNMIRMSIDINNQLMKIGSKKLKKMLKKESTIDSFSYYDDIIVRLNYIIGGDVEDPIRCKARDDSINSLITKMLDDPCKLIKTFKSICDSSTLMTMHFNWIKDHYKIPKDSDVNVTIFEENEYINTFSAFLQMIFALTSEELGSIRYGLFDQITQRNAIQNYLKIKGDEELQHTYDYILKAHEDRKNKYLIPLLFAIRGTNLYDILESVKYKEACLDTKLKENGILSVYPETSVLEIFKKI